MLYAIISDVHSNLEALNAVLNDIKKFGIKEIFFLGDSVGYGPDPDECTSILNSLCSVLIAGNHDMAIIGLTDISQFNSFARIAIEWTSKQMKAENISLLKRYKMLQEILEKNIFLVHATPKKPEEWSYIDIMWDVDKQFHYFDDKICFVGHSHKPFIIEKKSSGELLLHKEEVRLSEKSRYLINVGSVGQPRDRDPRASYCIFDNGLIYFRRIEYNIKKTQKKMMGYGLPVYLIERLSYGV